MKFEELIVLLPCHSLDDFPVHHEGPAAEGLLAAWSALWHPALLASAQRIPLWRRADDPPDQVAGRLIVVPVVSESMLPDGWAEKATNDGATLVRGIYTRADMVKTMLENCDGATTVSEDLAADFQAVGLCYLLVDLLTRLMRHTSHIDQPRLETNALAAANAAMAGNADEARASLRACVDALTEARERYYPVEAYFIDLTLMADSVLGEPLRNDLSFNIPQNLLLTGELITQMAEREPASLARLRSAIESGTACAIGGEWQELETPLLPPEVLLQNFRRGREASVKHLGRAPLVYARRKYGLSPVLPSLLKEFGYRGAVHFTLDDGRFPKSEQSKGIWEGFTTDTIDSLHKLPLDAAKAESFLQLPQKLGESMDYDYVATVTFARWPGAVSPYFDDLRRLAHYGAPLGRFVTLDDYFDRVAGQGGSNRYRADQYRAPYLRQAFDAHAPDPISRYVKAQGAESRRQARFAAVTLAGLVSGEFIEVTSEPDAETPPLSQELEAKLAVAFGATNTSPGAKSAGTLVFNPLTVARKVIAPEGDADSPILEVPAMGFVWSVAASATPAPSRSRRSLGRRDIAKGNTLRNEFVEISINSKTGGIGGVYDRARPQNRMSQQLAYRLPPAPTKPGDIYRDPDETAEYAIGVSEGMKIVANGASYGTIVTHGYLPGAKGTRMATFEQRFTLMAGSRVLEMQIHLTTDHVSGGDPWNCYFASRFAWADSNADLVASTAFSRHTTSAKRIEAPEFVEIRDARAKTTILTGGLPYHRRVGHRMIDTLLIVGNELERTFQLGVGVELAHPAQDAIEFVTPDISLPAGKPASGESGWLLHCDARNVLVTNWSPVVANSRVVGFRARLLETEGKSGEVTLLAFRPLIKAAALDLAGVEREILAVDGDSLKITLRAFEWREIEAMIGE